MINYIKNIFSRTKQNNTLNEEDISYENKIVFWIDANGQEYIKIYIKNTEPNLANKFAKMLYDINMGIFTGDIVNILQNMSKQDVDIASYVLSVVTQWKLLYSNNSLVQNNEPYIRPTSFNKYYDR